MKMREPKYIPHSYIPHSFFIRWKHLREYYSNAKSAWKLKRYEKLKGSHAEIVIPAEAVIETHEYVSRFLADSETPGGTSFSLYTILLMENVTTHFFRVRKEFSVKQLGTRKAFRWMPLKDELSSFIPARQRHLSDGWGTIWQHLIAPLPTILHLYR